MNDHQTAKSENSKTNNNKPTQSLEEEYIPQTDETHDIGKIITNVSSSKPNDVIALQRLIGNQATMNLVNRQPAKQPAPKTLPFAGLQIVPPTSIQRATADGEDPSEFEIKGQDEHDKQATPDIADTMYVASGDTVTFLPIFGQAIVTPIAAVVNGTGTATIDGKSVAVAGDEQSILSAGVPYITGAYTIPGVGNITIEQLTSDHYVRGSTSNGKALLQKGRMFVAKFQVTAPAMQPGPQGPIPDPTRQYMGQGHFITTSNPRAIPEGLDAN